VIAKLTRALDGVRLTSCKSAKDRTGMSVTLEEVQLAKEIYGLNGEFPYFFNRSAGFVPTIFNCV
jgi:hypothetical protein